MGLECGWRYARKRWSWEFEDFEKESFKIGPLRRELGIRPLRVEFWLSKDVVEFCRSLLTEILNITRCAMHWWGQHSKNCVSLLMSPWTEVKKLINGLYLKQQSQPVFSIVYILCYSCNWYHYHYSYTTSLMNNNTKLEFKLYHESTNKNYHDTKIENASPYCDTMNL